VPSEENWMSLTVATCYSFLFSAFVCFLIIKTSHLHLRFSGDAFDGVQKVHNSIVPRIGGLGVIIGLSTAIYLLSDSKKISSTQLAILYAALPAFLIGAFEDIFKNISARVRFFITLVPGLLFFGLSGTAIDKVGIAGIDWLLANSFFSVALTSLCVAAMANATNMLDGLNGLCAGVSISLGLGLGAIAAYLGDAAGLYFSLIFVGSVLGFAVFNWPLGRLFLGDGGAYFTGAILALMGIWLVDRNPSLTYLMLLLLFSYPVFEITSTVMRRLFKRVGTFSPDDFHLHSRFFRVLEEKKVAPPLGLNANNLAGLLLVVLHAIYVFLIIFLCFRNV
jgi:UDP-N-acetylmuramyl pentapeptide phosphotransferase/UDP-N-acetylglucosamine-1-phosphate transferase